MERELFSLVPKQVPKIKTKYRTIKTDIPAPGTDKLIERLQKVESRSMQGQIPIVWNKAKDFSVEDIAGNKWIDFTLSLIHI